jgi:hypothetical protein
MTVRKYSSRSQQTTLSSALTSVATSMVVVGGPAVMGNKTTECLRNLRRSHRPRYIA